MTLLERLEHQGITLEPKLTFKSTDPIDADTLEVLRENKAELLKNLTAPDTVPRLPWQLERLVSAAQSGQLPKDPTMLSSGLVPDLNHYTLGWAAAYLTGDRQEALSRLWQVRRAWQGETPS